KAMRSPASMRREISCKAVTSLPPLSKMRERASASTKRSAIAEPSIPEKKDTVGALCQGGTMGSDEHARSVAGCCKEFVQDSTFGRGVHFAGRLIADQHIGISREHCREAGSGCFTAGEG